MKKWKTDFRNSLQFLSSRLKRGNGRDRGCPPDPEEGEKRGAFQSMWIGDGEGKKRIIAQVIIKTSWRKEKQRSRYRDDGGRRQAAETKEGFLRGKRREEEARRAAGDGKKPGEGGKLEGQKLESKRKCFEAVLIEG